MADPVHVSRYGRDFEFDPGTSEEVQQRRIDAWMRANAPDELEATPAPKPVLAPMAPGAVPQRENAVLPAEEAPAGDSPFTYKKIAPLVMQILGGASPLGPLTRLPGMQERFGDINTLRTAAQGAVPFALADEGTALIRSLLGEDYTTALGEERQGLKDFEEKYGPGEAAAWSVAGAVPTIAATMGAGAATQLPQVLPRVAAHPWIASLLTGAASGAGAGFGAGEGGFDERAENAKGAGLLGAALGPLSVAGVKGAERVGRLFNRDSATAKYLRQRLGTELGDDLVQRGVRPAPGGAAGVDVNDPNFPTQAGQLLRRRDREARALGVDPMLSDQLPLTTEAALLKPGADTQGLSERLWRRQFDFRDPARGRQTGQAARVGDAFEENFGPNVFRKEEKQILKDRATAADPLFKAANTHNISGPEIEEALNSPLVKDAWKDALKFSQQAGHPIPNQIRGNVSSYNTGFLHQLKQALDDKIDANTDSITGRMNNKGQKYLTAKNKLNETIMKQNPDYKIAMEQYGDDSGRLGALKMGRDKIFLSEDKGGMSADQIRAYLADPSVSSAEKELFRTGAARALRAKVLEPTGKNYTHNWADFINKPGFHERMEALVDPQSTGQFGPQAWKKFQDRLNTEARNFAQFQRQTGNSRTAGRQELVKEIEASAPGEAIPNAYSARSAVIKSILDHMRGSPNVVGSGSVANRIASLLNTRTSRDTTASTRQIEQLLRGDMARANRFGTAELLAPHSVASGWPERTTGGE
jgi:hypothetical protein